MGIIDCCCWAVYLLQPHLVWHDGAGEQLQLHEVVCEYPWIRGRMVIDADLNRRRTGKSHRLRVILQIQLGGGGGGHTWTALGSGKAFF